MTEQERAEYEVKQMLKWYEHIGRQIVAKAKEKGN